MKLMIVEDNEDLIRLYKEEVAELEIKAEFFSDGRSAVEHYRASDQDFELIVTDVRMPLKSGEGLIFDVKSIKPAQKIAAVTAFPGDLSIPASFGVRIFEKPISLFEVLGEYLPPQIMKNISA